MILAKCKGNIPPVARGDTKWCGTRLELTFLGDKWEVEKRCRGGPVGERRALIGYVHLTICYVVPTNKK